MYGNPQGHLLSPVVKVERRAPLRGRSLLQSASAALKRERNTAKNIPNMITVIGGKGDE